MQNSTDRNKTETRKPKVKGPIRTEAVVPATMVFALIIAYFSFFFDNHLRRGLEFVATRIHGAEVNIADIDTSLLNASFLLSGLEVTDKTMPARNLFQVGEIRLIALWDALLRGKIVIEESSILDVRAYTQRKRPGFVAPPPPPGRGPGLLGKVQEEILEQTRKKLNKNFLGDIGDILSGTDPKEQLNKIQADLKSNLRAQELEKELAQKKQMWEERIKSLPKPKDVKDLEAKIKALKLDGKNPTELAANLKKAKELLSEAESKVKQVRDTQSEFSSDMQAYSNSVAQLQKLAEQDVMDLQKRLQIPSIDPKEFSTQLFLTMIESRLVSLRKYIAVARKYMPPKKSQEEIEAEKAQELLPPARGEGISYDFPITTGYPRFWLKLAKLSSEIDQSEWAGKVSGEIQNITTNPVQLGKPTTAKIDGDFPKKNIRRFQLEAELDHTTSKPRESLKARVGSFPVTEQLLSESEKVKLGLKEAVGSSFLEAVLSGNNINLSLQSSFSQPNFLLEARSKQVEEILSNVLKEITQISLSANVSGEWNNLSIGIQSNLGSALSRGFQKQLEAKLGDAKAKLNAFVNEKIAPNKKKAEEMLGSLKGGPGSAIEQKKAEMESSLNEAKSSATPGGPGDSIKEKGKKLFKGFGL